MSSCAGRPSELPPLVSWFRPRLRLSVSRVFFPPQHPPPPARSTSLSFQSFVSLPEHVLQKRPRCVLDAPLQSATLEIPAESIFGDLDSGFFACVDRGAPEQEIRRTHTQAYGKFLNATEGTDSTPSRFWSAWFATGT